MIFRVPAECKCLLESETVQPPPSVSVNMRRSGSTRGSPVARKSFHGRSFQSQQTMPKRWPFNAQRPTIDTSAPIQEQQAAKSVPQPTTPPPVDENLKSNKTFELVYKALDNSSDDDVFVDEEEKENGSEDVEELFLKVSRLLQLYI